MKVIQIRDDIYKSNILLIPKCTGAEVEKWMAKHFKSKYQHDPFCAAFHYVLKNQQEGEVYHFLIFEDLQDNKAGRLDLTHEALHLAFSVLTDVGIQYCDASEEAFNYYQTYIIEDALRKLYPQKKGKK